jgi:hypothetical protein
MAITERLLINERIFKSKRKLFREIVVVQTWLNFSDIVLNGVRLKVFCVKVLNKDFWDSISLTIDCNEVFKTVELVDN